MILYCILTACANVSLSTAVFSAWKQTAQKYFQSAIFKIHIYKSANMLICGPFFRFLQKDGMVILNSCWNKLLQTIRENCVIWWVQGGVVAYVWLDLPLWQHW